MSGGGGFLGNILGPVGAIAGSLLFPEFAIPAAAAGGFLGGTAGGLSQGEPLGQAALGGLETGGLAGATGLVGSALGLPSVGSLFSGGGGNVDLSGTLPGAAAPDAGSVGGFTPSGGGSVGSFTPTPDVGTALAAGPGAIGAGAAGAAGGGGGAAAGLPSPTGATLSPVSAVVPIGGTPLPSANTLGGSALPASVGTASPTDISSATLGAEGAGGAGAPTGSDFSSATAGGTGGGGGGMLDSVLNFVKENPMIALGGAGLGLSMLMNTGQVPGSQPIQNQAGELQGQAFQNMNAVNTGALPAGAQSMIDQQTQAAKADVMSRFAAMGIPPGSSMEGEALAQVDQNAAATKFKIADQLAQLGLNQATLSGGEFEQLMQAQIMQDMGLQNAIANFSGALAGSGLRNVQTG